MRKYVIFMIIIAFFIFFQSTPFYENLGIRDVQPDFVLIILSIASFLTVLALRRELRALRATVESGRNEG